MKLPRKQICSQAILVESLFNSFLDRALLTLWLFWYVLHLAFRFFDIHNIFGLFICSIRELRDELVNSSPQLDGLCKFPNEENVFGRFLHTFRGIFKKMKLPRKQICS